MVNAEKILKRLIFFYLALFPFGLLTRLPVSVLGLPEVNLYLTDLVVLAIASTWLVTRYHGKLKFPLARPLISFIVFALFSLIVNFGNLSAREATVGFLYLARWASYVGLYFASIDLVRNGILDRQLLIKSLAVVGVFSVLLGWSQYFTFPDVRALSVWGFDDHYLRIVGSFLDPNFAAIIFVLTLILIVGYFFREKPFWFWPSVGVIFTGLLFTYSRSGYLASIFGLGVLFYLMKRLKYYVGFLFLLLVGVYLLPKPFGEGVDLTRQSTVFARFENYAQTSQIIVENPIFGVGFNTLRYARSGKGFVDLSNSASGADNSFLFIAATTGLAGLLIYLSFWFQVLRLGYKRKQLLLVSSSLAVLVHGQFVNTLFYPWALGWFLLLLSSAELKRVKGNSLP